MGMLVAPYRHAVAGGSGLPSPPASAASARAIFYADTLALADGAAVLTWPSTNGTYTATSTIDNPIIKTAFLGGRNVIRTTGTANARMTVPATLLSGLTGTNGATVLYLGRHIAGSGPVFGDFGTDANANHYPFSDAIIYEDFCSTARKTTVNIRDILRDWHFGAMRSKTSLWDLWIEGTSRFSTVTNTFAVNTSTTRYLWYSAEGLVSTEFDLPVWALFDRYLSDAEVQEWEAYLNNLYSLGSAVVGSPDANTTFLCRFNTATPTDEVSGATATLFGNARTLTDKCQLVVDGSGDYITFPGGTINDEASANWTMEVHTNARGTNQGLIARAASDATAGRHVLYINSGGAHVQWYAKFGAASTVQITGTTTAPGVGAERHIALCRDGGTYRIYVGGVQVGSAANAGAIATSTDNLWIGNDPAFTTRYVQGSIGRVKFSNVCRYPSGTTFTPPSRFDA